MVREKMSKWSFGHIFMSIARYTQTSFQLLYSAHQGSSQIGPRQIGPLYYIYLYWIFTANNWGIYVSWIYISPLDIFCQQLEDICQLEGVCAPFGCSIGEWVHIHPPIDIYPTIVSRIYPMPTYKFNWHIFPNAYICIKCMQYLCNSEFVY